jgi:hypothetical protein
VPSDRPPRNHIVYGLSPNSPAVFSLPPVEARPDRPLPDTAVFLRILAGVDEPTTVLTRAAREYVGIWRHVYEYGRNTTAPVDEQLALLTWVADQEAGGHTTAIVVRPDAPTNPCSYGEMLAWLAWKYLLVALRQNQSAHAEHDAAQLMRHIEAFDHLVTDVRAGLVRLPEQATGELPPRTVRPNPDNGNEGHQRHRQER